MNPLLQPSELPYQLPPFAEIKSEHYLPAFDTALDDHDAEISAIVTNPEEPSWENTVEALEKSGQALARVANVFFNLNGTDASEEFDKISAAILPKLSAHEDAVYQNEQLYARIKSVTPPADEESQRLHEQLLRAFRRRGADLTATEKQQLSEYNQRLAVLGEEFRKNLLSDTTKLAVSLSEDELAGFSDSRKAAAADAANALGREGYVIPLELPTVQSEQASLDNPEARAKLYEASLARGTANAEVALEMVRLRAQRAELLGYANHAEYVLEEETAKTPEAVRKLLHGLAPAAATNAQQEYKLISEDNEVEAADWSYYESKIRARDYALDEDQLRQYFPLESVLVNGVFYAANLLYGITVEPRDDLAGYHEDVKVWEVKESDGTGIGLFLTDYFGRPSKRGGAWMSSFVDQSRLLGTKPVIINVMGITKTENPLLTLDEVTTLFHEFGHALHGLLSDVRYPTFSGTNVPRDYVEFPSQINENWAFEPQILANYARNAQGEVIPTDLVAAIEAAKQFGQGFGTSEYLGAAIIDFAWHSLSAAQAADVTDVEAFESAALEDAGLVVDKLAPRYKTCYFNHIFGGGYSAGYYSYLWAEALDADGFDWFKEQSDMRAAGQRFRELVLSKGASKDFDAAYEQLRGRARDLTPLLTRRGLAGTEV
ncbi:M3 family metallopeptidase [Corynebacterium epidermidicanis]|uniref:Zn-dependent oligopeptidase n=1 Tax=Corynebacterium epidermidicanis TaxID=1050174 RepID=A0A0G3GVW4_9CORY|nr:M3 family metallopeptidase [Corynebacterium epidermidicanis]AKK03643.1 Zn-dependent oligopeptidase [Corynebacterium epidermidicanis]